MITKKSLYQVCSPADRTAFAWQQWQLAQPGPVTQQFNAEIMLNATQVKEDFARLVCEAITVLNSSGRLDNDRYGVEERAKQTGSSLY